MVLVMGCVEVNLFPKRYRMNFVCFTICSKLRMAYISSYFGVLIIIFNYTSSK